MDQIVVLIKKCHDVRYEDNVLGIYPYLDFEERGIKTVPITNNKNKNMRIMNIFKHVQDASLILLDTSDPQYINQVMTWFVDTRNHDDAPDSLAGLVKIVE